MISKNQEVKRSDTIMEKSNSLDNDPDNEKEETENNPFSRKETIMNKPKMEEIQGIFQVT